MSKIDKIIKIYDDTTIKKYTVIKLTTYYSEENENSLTDDNDTIVSNIEKVINKMGLDLSRVYLCRYSPMPHHLVVVEYNGEYFGIFNSKNNRFESTPKSRH